MLSQKSLAVALSLAKRDSARQATGVPSRSCPLLRSKNGSRTGAVNEGVVVGNAACVKLRTAGVSSARSSFERKNRLLADGAAAPGGATLLSIENDAMPVPQ